MSLAVQILYLGLCFDTESWNAFVKTNSYVTKTSNDVIS